MWHALDKVNIYIDNTCDVDSIEFSPYEQNVLMPNTSFLKQHLLPFQEAAIRSGSHHFAKCC